MKASNATSARATGSPPLTGPSSARRPTPTTADSFSLAGPTDAPDAAFHAYRRDLADLALAGTIISSHYAEPVDRRVAERTMLRAGPSGDADVIRALEPGEPFAMLEDSVGWAWGYAGVERRVGYVGSEAIVPA